MGIISDRLAKEIGALLALDDLDLEFEDEDEAKKKKNEAVQVDVDLEFSTPNISVAKSSMPNGGERVSSPPELPTRPPPNSPVTPVAKIEEARNVKASANARATATAGQKSLAPGKVVGANALQADQFEIESQQIVEMREQLRRTQFEADVKVAIAEYKTELLSELLSDTKLLQHQMEQLLTRINAKHPDLKQEILLMKKILADFSGKKRK